MLRLSLTLAFLASSVTAFMPLALAPARLSTSTRQMGLRGGSGLKMAEVRAIKVLCHANPSLILFFNVIVNFATVGADHPQC